MALALARVVQTILTPEMGQKTILTLSRPTIRIKKTRIAK
jgi:hypothetical protein